VLSRIVNEIAIFDWIKDRVIKQIKVAMGTFKAHAKEYPSLNHKNTVSLSRIIAKSKYQGLYLKY
jgi:hypothetical protein